MRKNKGMFWILAGLLLIVAALFLSAYNLHDERRAEQSAMQAVDRLEEVLSPEMDAEPSVERAEEGETPVHDEETVIPDYILSPDMEMPVETVDGIDYIGVLRVPVLELELPVISQWGYPSLKIAPCRYGGSAYLDDLVLCAHNYSSHFGNLKTLQPGDAVTFTDMDGNEFHYEVAEVETLQPGAVEEMESGDWDLTLFTCTIGGRKRVTVRCERIGE